MGGVFGVMSFFYLGKAVRVSVPASVSRLEPERRHCEG